MINVFNKKDVDELIGRINKLKADSQPNWGTMSVEKMLAHCNVTYEMVYDSKHPRPSGFMRFVLRLIVKPTVVNNVPYKQNLKTAPAFIISDERNYEIEKSRLIDYIVKTCELGENFFDGKESLSFGKLNKFEWNNMFAKHLDHHLRQFGV